MYHSFLPLPELDGIAHRIFDPLSYVPPICERFVPISIEESFHLSSHYPIAWRRNEVGGLELVAIRTLSPNSEIPGIRRADPETMPLLLQAYPFRYRNHLLGDFEIGLDRVAPISERNAGSYLYDHLGRLSAGAELKLEKLKIFERSYFWERSLTSALIRHNLLEAIELPHELRRRFDLPDFFTATLEFNHAILLSGIPHDSWKSVLTFLTAQRLSLYRMERIIRLSKGEVRIA